MTTEAPNTKPRSSSQFFSWFISDPILFRKYENTLTKKQKSIEFLKSYLWIILVVVLCWLIVNAFIASLDLPLSHPDSFRQELVEEYRNQAVFLPKFTVLIQHTAVYLALGLALGLLAGSIVGLNFDLPAGLAVGLAAAFIFGLALKLTAGLTYSILFGLISGLTVGLAGGLAHSLIFGLLSGLTSGVLFGLIFGLIFGPAAGLGAGLGVFSGWNISYFRLFPFYPLHVIGNLFSHGFSKNAYRRDGVVWLPIPGLKARLIREARHKPEEAFDFIDFLLSQRPRQKTLAMDLTHAATAGLWLQENFYKGVLKQAPIISEDRPEFKPSREWYEKLARLRQTLVTAGQQSNIGFKVEYFEKYLKHLEEFAEITLKKESSRWNRHYFEALDKWRQQAEDECHNLKISARTLEPITPNRYRANEALTPELDQEVFVGREDLKATLQNRIISSVAMPMFLIHGQRRVGKTSLLKFLPHILGPGFKVVFLDLQHLAGIGDWFGQLRQRFDEALRPGAADSPSYQDNDWLASWRHLQQHMEKSAHKEECKIILAFDEYEKVHQFFQGYPGAAADLLGAMRSFSQHQNRIVFLFVGTYLFYELKNPDWSNYFVQAVLLKVDYLEREDTFRLIRVAQLDYPQEVLEEIYRLTQGHPALLQKICYEMVNIANTNNRKRMTGSDLEEILRDYIFIPQNGVTDVFWQQFCKEDKTRTTVRQVIDGKEPIDKKSLFPLLEHGFVVKQDGRFKMRVPIFETWVNRFGDYL